MKTFQILTDLGYTQYEAKILLSLQQLGSAEVKTIAKHSKVPKNKVYDILNQLQQQQIVQVLPTKPKQYALISLKENLHDRIKGKIKQLDQLQKTIDTIPESTKEIQEMSDTFWIMEGATSMVNKIIETLSTVESESIGFIDLWTAKASNLRAVKKAIDRGVIFYFLGSINKQTRQLAKEYAKLGVNIRHHDVSGAGYSIFDKKHVQLRVTSEKVVTMWIENEQFANILREHFFTLWEQAKPVS